MKGVHIMKKYALKLTVLALVATFLFSFAACKKKTGDATTTASAKEHTTEAATEADTAEETAEETEAETE